MNVTEQRGLSLLDRIVFAVLPDYPELPAVRRREAALSARRFVASALAAAPWHIRFAERLVRVALWRWLLPVSRGAPLDSAPDARIDRAVSAFEAIAPPTANAVRLYRSLALLGYFENPAVMAEMGFEATGARQQRYRDKRQELESA